MTGSVSCSFCGCMPRSLHLLRLPRGTYRACGACLRTLTAECQAIAEEAGLTTC